MEVSVNLPKQLYRNVSDLAKAKKKSVPETIKSVLRKAVKEESEAAARPLAGCSDEEVLAVAKMKMPQWQADRHSEMLYKNQAGTLTPLERNELEGWLMIYQWGNLRKAQGITEAVTRGLIKSPEDLE
jgi:hypothetical protein